MLTTSTGTLAFTSDPSIESLTGDLTFAVSPDTHGVATFDVFVRDSGSGLLPNVNESSTQQFTIEVGPINDAPVLAVNTGLAAERGVISTITAAHLETTDIDSSPAELHYVVTTSPVYGAILVDGAPAAVFTQAQVNAGLVSYQNDGSENWTDSFAFEVDDGHALASAGVFNIHLSPYPGDYNRDLIVDAADFTLWRHSVGTTGLSPFSGADGNGDGIIDQADYDVWRAHFGETAPAFTGGEEQGTSTLALQPATGASTAGGESHPEAQAVSEKPSSVGGFVRSSQTPTSRNSPRSERLSRQNTAPRNAAAVGEHAMMAWLASHRSANHASHFEFDAPREGENNRSASGDALKSLDAAFAATLEFRGRRTPSLTRFA
jgi:hypothetical protein